MSLKACFHRRQRFKMLSILFLCFASAFAEIEQYHVVSHVDGENIIRDITFDEDENFAEIKQTFGSDTGVNLQFHDFNTGYAAVKSDKCIVSRDVFSLEDVKNFIVAHVTNDNRNAAPSVLLKPTSPIADLATLAGQRVAEFCGSLNAFKGILKKETRSKHGHGTHKKRCWAVCCC